MPSTLRVWLRGSRLLVHVATGLLIAAAINLDGSRRLQPEPLASWWSRRLLAILNIRLRVVGTPLEGARLTVANHISWIDVTLLSATQRTRFVAKSDIRDWPVAGWIANAAGTFYIRRGKGGSGPLLERLTPHLAEGGSVVLFPEGTTTDGRSVQGFHARMFAAAIDAQVPVQPVALRYPPEHDSDRIAPFIGDDNLLSHVLRVLRTPTLAAELIYLPPIDVNGRPRDEIAQQAETAVRVALFANAEAGPRRSLREMLAA